MPLTTGGILLNLGDGTIVVVNSDGSLRERPFPSGPDGRYRHHKIIELSDGRLLVSTSGRGTRVWSADGEPGPRILDEEISGATLLSDGNFLVWPADRSDLRIVGEDGRLEPVLRGHRSEILDAFQLADGRIVSWGKDIDNQGLAGIRGAGRGVGGRRHRAAPTADPRRALHALPGAFRAMRRRRHRLNGMPAMNPAIVNGRNTPPQMDSSVSWRPALRM